MDKESSTLRVQDKKNGVASEKTDKEHKDVKASFSSIASKATESAKKATTTVATKATKTAKQATSTIVAKVSKVSENYQKSASSKGKKTADKSTESANKKTVPKTKSLSLEKTAKKTKKTQKPKSQKHTKDIKFIDGSWFKKMVRGGAALLRLKSDEVNKLNVFPVPDGDTGDNMRMTIESGIAAIENMDSDDLAEVMKVLSHGMLLGARGNSGVILSQFFAGFAKGLESTEKADPETVGKALEMGVQKAYTSVMKPTEGTILTVARESVEYAVSRITPQSTIRTLFADLAKEMHESLERTPEILAVLKEAGVVDSGGAGLFYIIDGFNRVLNGEQIESEETIKESSKSAVMMSSSFGPDSVMTYGYCTELLVQLQNSKTDIEAFDVEPLKEFLASIGDSIVAFKTESIVKLHVHTMTPEKVLEKCRTFGEFISVKIENMSVQHTELEENENAPVKEIKKEKKPSKKMGVVTVSNGPGIDALFKELGADEIVPGGQTQNPSINDFLDAFEKVNAEHIIVLPNNSNIIMAANQAAEIYTDATIHVVPSKNLGKGYVALSSADLSSEDVDSVIASMEEAMERVTAGYVSPSIRDADINGIKINKGDTIGIIDKTIVVADSVSSVVSKKMVSILLDAPGRFMLTVFCGKDAKETEREELECFLNESYPSAEFYFVDGGQDVYPYIFVAE